MKKIKECEKCDISMSLDLLCAHSVCEMTGIDVRKIKDCKECDISMSLDFLHAVLCEVII